MFKTGFRYLFIILLFITTRLFSQGTVNEENLLFTHLTTKDGLSYNGITCFFKDSRGFMWIGTGDGLNRYDGSSIKTFYHHASDKRSIASNIINQIAEDRKGNLWIATVAGLSKLNLKTELIENFTNDPKDNKSIADNMVRSVFVGAEGEILTGGRRGLDEYDPLHNNFIHYSNNGIKGTGNHDINKIYWDSKRRIWISCMSGLYLFNKAELSFTRVFIPVTCSNKEVDNLTNDIFEDHNHQLWITTWGGGLKKFFPETGKIETYKWNPAPVMPSADNIALAVTECRDRHGKYHLWVAGGGLADFNTLTDAWSFYRNNIQNANTLSANYTSCVYTDNTGLLWIGTNEGINILDPNKQFFTTHKFDKKIIGNEVTNMGEPTSIFSTNNNIWLTTWYGNGLYKFDNRFNLLRKWRYLPPDIKNPDNYQVSSIVADNDVEWISTFHGLVAMNEKKNTYKLYLPDSSSKGSIPSAHLVRVFIDSRGVHWVIFYHSGFAWLDPATGVFTPKGEPDGDHLARYIVNDVVEDNDGNVWFACDYFLLRYDRAANTFKRFGLPDFLPGLEALCLLKDHDGKIWAGTRQGVSVIDPKTLEHHFITTENGLCNNDVESMLEDSSHHIWLATKNGLNVYDPVKATFRIFKREDGLETDNLVIPFQALSDGRFLLAGNGYVTEFYPDSLNYNKIVPPVVITAFRILGQPVLIPVNEVGEKALKISYKQNEFAFDFSVLNYTNPSANKFYCKMEGFDKEWRQLKKGTVSYTNLDPGNYTFRVKGANNNGVTNEQGDFVRLYVSPPFWKTWLFRVLAVLFISAVVAFFVSYRINQITKEERRKTEFNAKIAEARMQALRAQMNPHFIFNSLNSIQECVVTGKNDEAAAYLSKFSRLVRMILENSSKEKITLSAELDSLKLYLDVEALRFAENFTYSLDLDPNLETELIQIPPMLIQPYVENALWHGLAHKEGEKKLAIKFTEVKNILVCEMEDNGIGRERAMEMNHNKHKSVAMKNTAERLDLLGHSAQVEIIDLPEHSGTKVILQIPI